MLENKEVWKDIKGYKDYQVSNFGRVWNAKSQRYVSSFVNNSGYEIVHMYADNGKRKHELVHRLVALTFIPNPNNLPQVNHIDSKRTNNHVENLEWVTIKENVMKSTLPKKIKVCDLKGNELYMFDCIEEACKTLHLTRSNVSCCLSPNGKQKTHKKFMFQEIN